MGGNGSGRPWGTASYGLTDDSQNFDIRKIKREGCLLPGRQYTWQWTRRSGKKNSVTFNVEEHRLCLDYKSRVPGGEWQHLKYPVYFSNTRCHLGGERTWFLCPGSGCGKRVAILYGGKYFLCRECAGLVYESQRESDLDRMTRRLDKIRNRLKWSQGFLNGPERKPKGMHRRTYWKLFQKYEKLSGIVSSEISSRFGMHFP